MDSPLVDHRDDGATWRWAGAIALLCHLVWFGADVVQGGFRNLDVAGIAYNAQLLLDGLLPYVDSWEPKPPGTFFLFAAILSVGSMHTVWAVAILWGAATSLAVASLAERLWGRNLVIPAAALHAGGALLPTQADINYVFWATLPMVLALAMACKAPERVRRPWLHWGLVGAAAMTAVLLKQSAVGLILVLPLAVYWRGGGRWPERIRASIFGVIGAAMVFVTLAAPWIVAGEFGALVVGLGLRGGWWVDYSAAQAQAMGSAPAVVGRGAYYVLETLQIGSAVAILGLLGLPRSRADEEDEEHWQPYAIAVSFLLASFFGLAVTLRFYLHYLAQLWPAMVVVALNPRGGFASLLDKLTTFGLRRSLACLVLALCGTLLRADKVNLRVGRTLNNQVVEELCETIRPHLAVDDTVLAWGWPSWGVYTHCGRRAPGPIYKAMSVLTTSNTNTGWQRTKPMKLREGPASERFVSDFLETQPALFLWSPGYARDGSEPLLELTPITAALQEDYRGVELERGYVAFLRRDLLQAVRSTEAEAAETTDLRTVLEKWNPDSVRAAAR